MGWDGLASRWRGGSSAVAPVENGMIGKHGRNRVFQAVNFAIEALEGRKLLTASTPFLAAPINVPSTIQAENFDEGGAGVGYVDLSAGNTGAKYRSTDVDIESTSDTGGGYDVGWVQPGEWLQYTINVQTSGSYTLDSRVAWPGQGGTFHVEWKAGPTYVSNIYNEPMPWATFFATGGIAFHGGSLTAWSHGCVHLTDQNAHFYNEHLPIGAEVVVF